jgi:two-component system response regulator FixJ
MGDLKKVHIIDDDQIIRDSIELLLTTFGFEAFTYASAPDFLQHAAAPVEGCVVTDVRMPEMSGIELMKKMKQLRMDLPIVVITGDADVMLAIEALKAGANDFLEKPFDGEDLIASVSAALADKDASNKREIRSEESRARFASLSASEKKVFVGLIAGKTNRVLATELAMSVAAIEGLRAQVLLKMKARSLSELVRMALKADLGAFQA